MSQISASQVKELRDKTGAGMMDCKNALKESEGNVEQAVDLLRKKGLKSVEKRSSRVAAEGVVYSYIHPGSKVGVLLELNCETDFVAKSEDFTNLAKALAMHIAWANPKYLKREDIPQEEIEREKSVLKETLEPGQEKFADKIIEGRLKQFFADSCLLEQVDAQAGGKKTIEDSIKEVAAKVGENVSLRRFQRLEVGEGIEKEEVDYAKEVAEAAGLS